MTATQTTAPVDTLGAHLRGTVVLPGDAGYDEARAVHNGMIDRHPAAIARCADEVDVARAVLFAREHALRIAVRGGGHNAGGLGVWDNALVVDLSGMRGVHLDRSDWTVRVQGGATWGDVDHITVAQGRAVPSGLVSTTGVGGLTLGGGIGYLARLHGLTVDNLVEAQLVLADGSSVTASEEEHPDLFWALRGGGGNFGVVTSFRFRSHPVGEGGVVLGGPVLYDVADAGDVIRWYREVLPALPEEISGWLGLLRVPSGPPFPESLWDRPVCGIVWCWTGPHDRGQEVLGELAAYGSPLLVGMHDMPFSQLQSAFDGLYPPGYQWYWKADFYDQITDEAVHAHQRHGSRPPTSLSTMHLYPVDGAVTRVPEDATAFPHRSGGWAGVVVGIDPDPGNRELITGWSRAYWEALRPSAAGGAYVNFLMEEGADRVRAAYRGNYDRLARVKARYDPDNTFRVNQNIPPHRGETSP
ncbi:FAD-binding oxidoreductase [Ornithinimicrobium sp. LYQ121]|uniref:FAD-binding oxidoreductase n=1 Tax=Ornithinimicrobium sp. LYQ121 TaxID=3378801 RepID=UPI0038525D51